MTKFKNALLMRELKAGTISKGRLYQLTGLKLEPKKVDLNNRNKMSFILYTASGLSILPWIFLSRFWSAPIWTKALLLAALLLFEAATVLLDQKNLESWVKYRSEKSEAYQYYSKYEQYWSVQISLWSKNKLYVFYMHAVCFFFVYVRNLM